MVHWFHGRFSVKSLSSHLKTAYPMNKRLFSAIWKSGSPRRTNILIWIMIFESLNSSEILQKKSPNKYLSPSICPLCLKASETLRHIFLIYPISSFSLDFWSLSKRKCGSSAVGSDFTQKISHHLGKFVKSFTIRVMVRVKSTYLPW